MVRGQVANIHCPSPDSPVESLDTSLNIIHSTPHIKIPDILVSIIKRPSLIQGEEMFDSILHNLMSRTEPFPESQITFLSESNSGITVLRLNPGNYPCHSIGAKCKFYFVQSHGAPFCVLSSEQNKCLQQLAVHFIEVGDFMRPTGLLPSCEALMSVITNGAHEIIKVDRCDPWLLLPNDTIRIEPSNKFESCRYVRYDPICKDTIYAPALNTHLYILVAFMQLWVNIRLRNLTKACLNAVNNPKNIFNLIHNLVDTSETVFNVDLTSSVENKITSFNIKPAIFDGNSALSGYVCFEEDENSFCFRRVNWIFNNPENDLTDLDHLSQAKVQLCLYGLTRYFFTHSHVFETEFPFLESLNFMTLQTSLILAKVRTGYCLLSGDGFEFDVPIVENIEPRVFFCNRYTFRVPIISEKNYQVKPMVVSVLDEDISSATHKS